MPETRYQAYPDALCVIPQAVDKNLIHRGSCRGKPQTPRAGSWREGGTRGSFPELSAGPLDLAASRAPSDFFRERIGRITRIQPHRENDEGWPENESEFRDATQHHPSHSWGRVARAEAKPSARRVGTALLDRTRIPHPAARYALASTLPEGGEGWLLRRCFTQQRAAQPFFGLSSPNSVQRAIVASMSVCSGQTLGGKRAPPSSGSGS